MSTTSTRGKSTGRHDQALIDKVQKLLRLATSDVEHEAYAAMTKARELMDEHGLSMEAVSQQKKTQRGVAEEIAQKETSGIQYWQKWIASALAKQFRCRVLYRSYHQGYRDIVIIGMPDDAATCSRTMTFAFHSARNCWEKYRATRRFSSRKQSSEAKREYMLGYARGLYKAFEQRNRSRSLVVRKNPGVDAYIRRLNLGTEAAPHRARRPDAHARSNGFTEGKRAHAAGRPLTAAASR